MVIAIVSRRDMRWFIGLAYEHGHQIQSCINTETAVEAIRSGDVEAVLVDVRSADEGERKRLKRIAREHGIPKKQVMLGDPEEAGARGTISDWVESLT